MKKSVHEKNEKRKMLPVIAPNELARIRLEFCIFAD